MFRKCTDEDFRSRGFKKALSNTHRFLCPDAAHFGDKWKLKNNYANTSDRHSFSL